MDDLEISKNGKKSNKGYLSKVLYGALLFGALAIIAPWDNGKSKNNQILSEKTIDKNHDSIKNVINFDLIDNNQSNGLVCNLSRVDVIADSLIKKWNYELAIDLLLQEKDSLLKLNDNKSIKELWNAYSYLWQSYFALEKYDLGFQYYQKAYEIAEKNLNNREKLFNLNDIAGGYISLNQSEKAFEYLNKANNILENIDVDSWEDIYVSYLIYTNLSNYYVSKQQFEQARPFFDKAKDIVFSNSNFWIDAKIVVLSCEADFSIADKKYTETISIYRKALELAKEIDYLEYQEWLLGAIEWLYMNLKNYKKAYEYHKMYSDVRSKRISIESETAIKDAEIKYQTKEIQYENETNKQKIELNKQEIKLQKEKTKNITWITISSLLVTLLSLWGGYVINGHRKKVMVLNEEITEQKDQIEWKNSELRQANEELIVLNETVKEKNEELEEKNEQLNRANNKLNKLNTELVEQKQEIDSSIEYASIVQKALLHNNIWKFFPNFFVFNKPKNIIGWDFYFSTELSDWKKLLAVWDCTWHGVPAALLTIFWNSNIRKLVNTAEEPSDIVLWLDVMFMDLYNQGIGLEENNLKRRDSIDLACLYFDPQTNILEYSLSSRPIVLVRDGQIKKLETEARVAIWSERRNPRFKWFKTYTIQLEPWDDIFLSSDGMSDQFVWWNWRKFGTANFMNFLKKLVNVPVADREEYVKKYYFDLMVDYSWWQTSQTDDMLLVWFKV